MAKTSKSQSLTLIPISLGVEFQLSKIMNTEKSYSKVIQNLITNYWKINGNWNKSNIKPDGEEPAKTNLTNPNLSAFQSCYTVGVV